MSILIQGLELPKNPGAYSMEIRLFVREDGTASIWGLKEYIPYEPLNVIPVPPHGKLGDLDSLAKEVKDMAKEFPPDSIGAERYRLFAEFIKTVPTIIPAEEGE